MSRFSPRLLVIHIHVPTRQSLKRDWESNAGYTGVCFKAESVGGVLTLRSSHHELLPGRVFGGGVAGGTICVGAGVGRGSPKTAAGTNRDRAGGGNAAGGRIGAG